MTSSDNYPGDHDSTERNGREINRWPISEAACTMLRELGETPDPEVPYILQLASWALSTGAVEMENDVVETVNAMITWRYERLMNFLMLREEGQTYEPPGWSEASGDAAALAAVILTDLEQKMVTHFPWYRSFSW